MDRRHNADVIVETLALEGKRVIDVGCGDGSLARRLVRHGARVLGVECSPRQLAKARAAPSVPGVDIVEGIGQSLPVASGTADYVVFFNSLHHIPPSAIPKALDEAARVLKPGGWVYVSEPLAEGAFFETCRLVDDETQLRAHAYAALMATNTLKPIREFRYVHTVVMRTFAAFRERMVSANTEREAFFDSLSEPVRSSFESNGTRTDDGWAFDQPMRVNLLAR